MMTAEQLQKLTKEQVREWELAYFAGKTTEQLGEKIFDALEAALARAEGAELAKSVLNVSPLHYDNCDGDSGPYWKCRMCDATTPGEHKAKPKLLEMRHFDECPVSALRASTEPRP